MSHRTKWIIAILTTIVCVGSAGAALAAGAIGAAAPDETTRLKAEEAALDYTGGGEVLEVEADDAGPGWEVEVRRADGSVVEVWLDQEFSITGSGADDADAPDEQEGP